MISSTQTSQRACPQLIVYKYNVYGNGNIFLGYGWGVGTTILKEIEIFEKTSFSGIQSAKTARITETVLLIIFNRKSPR